MPAVDGKDTGQSANRAAAAAQGDSGGRDEYQQ
jgi:hypothetical protein